MKEATLEQLPSYPNQFIGRASAFSALQGMLSDARLVTIVGPPGVGKTRLLSELGRQLSTRLCFVALSEATEEASLLRLLAQALSAEQETLPSIVLALQQQEALLLLDNVEHILAPAQKIFAELLQQLRHARILCTSRQRLGLADERVYELAPLSVLEPEAAALFLARAREAQQGFSAEPAALTALVTYLDGLPLAIELAAARVKLFSVPQLLAKLSERFRLLRQPNMRALEDTIASSWELLAPYERAALAQCALFRGGFSLEAAEQIIDLSAYPDAPWVFDVLQALCERSLLQQQGGASSRMGLLLCIRDFVAQRCEATPQKFSRFFLQEAEARLAQLHTEQGTEAQRWFSEERENLLEVHRLGLHHQNPAWVADSALCLARSFTGAARNETILALLTRAIEQPVAPLLLGQLLDQRGRISYLRGALSACLSDVTRAQEIAAEQRAPRLLASTCNHLGAYYLRTRELEQAEDFLQRASSLFETISDPHQHGLCEGQRALLAKKRGDYQRALERYERSLQLRQQARDLPGEATSLLNLSYFLKGQHRLAEARLYAEQVLPIAQRLSDKRLEAGYLGTLGAIYQEEGALLQAIALLEQASQLLQAIGKRLLFGWFSLLLGQAYHELGRFNEARRQYEAVLDRRERSEPAQESLVWSFLGVLAAQEQRWQEAKNAFEVSARFADASREPIARLVWGILSGVTSRLQEEASGVFGGGLHKTAQALLEEAPLAPSGLLPSMVSWDVRFARKFARALLREPAPEEEAPREVLKVGPECRWFSYQGAQVSLQQRRAPRLLLMALVAHHQQKQSHALSVDALFAKGWPNETAHPDAARSRVYTALNLLRSLGLKEILLRRDDGYLLSPTLQLEAQP